MRPAGGWPITREKWAGAGGGREPPESEVSQSVGPSGLRSSNWSFYTLQTYFTVHINLVNLEYSKLHVADSSRVFFELAWQLP